MATILDMIDDGKVSISPSLNFLSERERKLLDVDIKEPDSMARDILMDRYTNYSPSFQDFGEAVNFIMNTAKYIKRIEALVKYERLLFFKQRPELGRKLCTEKSDSANSDRTEDILMKDTKSTNNPELLICNLQPIIYGPNLLNVIEKIIDAVEGKVGGEKEVDYHFRREQAAIEFVTAFYHLKVYEQSNKCEGDQSSASVYHSFYQHIINKFLYDSFKEGNNLVEKKKYKAAASKYLDGAFACMCRLHQDNGETVNILKPLLQCSSEEKDLNEEPETKLPTIDKLDIAGDNGLEKDENYSNSSDEESDSETEPLEDDVPHDLLYLECKIKLIDCLVKDKQLKKASRYANHLIRWMCQKKSKDTVGYYAINYPEKYSLLESYFGEAECQLGNYKQAVEGCASAIDQYFSIGHSQVSFESRMFSARQNFFGRLVDEWDINNSLNLDRKLDVDMLNGDAEIENRAKAKIIVDMNRKKGLINDKTQFVVNDIDSALRIAKDGDIIFLEEGTYSGTKLGKKKDGTEEKMIEVLKNIEIIGIKTSKVRLIGSIIKNSKGQATFRNITFQVGKDQGSSESIYAMSGVTKIVDCCIKSPANTAIHVISESPGQDTVLELNFCVIDGMNFCERVISFEGYRPVINVQNCHVSDAMSFCVVLAPDSKCSVSMVVIHSLFLNVQDGIKIILHHESLGPPSVVIIGCHFELIAYRTEDGSPSIAVCQTAGIAKLENNYIYVRSHDVPSTGISLHSLQYAKLAMNSIASTAEVPRQFSVSKGIMITECLKTEIESTEISGMRVGIKVANKIEEEDNAVKIQDCSIRHCSVGLLISGNGNQNDSNCRQNTNAENQIKSKAENNSGPEEDSKIHELEGNELVTNPSKLRELISKQNDPYVSYYIEPNIYLKMIGCYIETSYYGVMNETAKGQICIEQNTFQNVPKGILLSHDCLSTDKVELVLNEFQLTDAFDYSEVNFQDAKEVENLRRLMYINFSVHENLPHRMAYNKKNYFVVSSHFDQVFLFANNLASPEAATSEDKISNEAVHEITGDPKYKEMI